jgi:hypothetical protein
MAIDHVLVDAYPLQVLFPGKLSKTEMQVVVTRAIPGRVSSMVGKILPLAAWVTGHGRLPARPRLHVKPNQGDGDLSLEEAGKHLWTWTLTSYPPIFSLDPAAL